ncbi:hypothetical protein ACJX0J_012815, partial [Zea mays]
RASDVNAYTEEWTHRCVSLQHIERSHHPWACSLLYLPDGVEEKRLENVRHKNKKTACDLSVDLLWRWRGEPMRICLVFTT